MSATAETQAASERAGGDRKECDLVMKGGITSGVVYPSAIAKLSKSYRFRNIGGASAGAIAAAVTAAAALRLRETGSDEGFKSLGALGETIASEGFLAGLFQPAAGARSAYKILLKFVTDQRSLKRRIGRALVDVLWRQWWFLLLAAAATYLVSRSGDVWLTVVSGLVFFVLAMVLSIAALVFATLRTIRRNGWGICPGTKQGSSSKPALTEWLHEEIQNVAGRNKDDPVTFADLLLLDEDGKPDPVKNIDLQLITTDLSHGRPFRIPFEERDNPYLFKSDELRKLFPPPVMTHLENVSEADVNGFRKVPGAQLPIVVGARLSLSFPILLSTVKFYSRPYPNHPERVATHTMSDGGISSNFPIHFFDSWLPRRPTFGLDLQPFDAQKPTAAAEAQNQCDFVWMPSGPMDPIHPRFVGVTSVGSFFSQIFDSARNWRDTMQMELGGFRERVCHIQLTKKEGGLNLNMDRPTIKNLLERGVCAADQILERFDSDDALRNHRFARFLTLMQMLQVNLPAVQRSLDDRFGEQLSAGDFAGSPFAAAHNGAWCTAAKKAVDDVVGVASSWGPPPKQDFDMHKIGEEYAQPYPTPAMRITPRV
jgi:predicted acylesterase/phospholipase RssA